MSKLDPLPEDLALRWLARRSYPELPEEAERLIRRAGLAWHDERAAGELLAQAEARAPGHWVTLLAQYRFRLYKHRFAEAAAYAARLLAHAAAMVGLPARYQDVDGSDPRFAAPDEELRVWLWALQAWGYVLLRAGEEQEGLAALRHLAQLDGSDQTKTRALLEAIARRGREDEGA